MNKVLICSLLFVLTFLVYTFRYSDLPQGDTVPNRLLPFNILAGQGLYFDAYSGISKDDLYFFQKFGKHIISAYPMLTGVLTTPLIIPVYLYLRSQHLDTPYTFFLISLITERVTAALLTSITVVCMFLLLGRLINNTKQAVLYALVYAFATQAFSINSQLLWQHGVASMFMVLSQIWFLRGVRGKQSGAGNLLSNLLISMAFGLLAMFTRYIFLFYFVLTSGLVIANSKRYKKLFLGFTLLGLAIFFTYNFFLYGTLFGTEVTPISDWTSGNLITGLLGILVSPARGMLFYTPFFALALLPLPFLNRIRTLPPVQQMIIKLNYIWLVGIIVVYSSFKHWWGGRSSWGDRYLADGAVSAVILVYYVLSLYKFSWLKGLVILLVIYSCFTQIIGAFYYPRGKWDTYPTNVNFNSRRLWDLQDNPIIRNLKAGPSQLTIYSIYKDIEKDIEEQYIKR